MRIKTVAVVCLILVLIIPCKKINLLPSSYIPTPTTFPNINEEKPEIPDYPLPTLLDEFHL